VDRVLIRSAWVSFLRSQSPTHLSGLMSCHKHGLKSILIANPIPIEKASLRTERQPDPGCVVYGMQPFSLMNTEAMRPSTLPSRPSSPQNQNQVDAYFFFSAWFCSFRTFLTIFCSSMRKARTMRSRTQLPHLEPPYARWTVFLGLEIWAYSRGRRAGT
jgi:hypothetical protein